MLNVLFVGNLTPENQDVKKSLQEVSFRVSEFHDGKSAIKSLNRRKVGIPDLILLDLSLTGMSAFQLSQYITVDKRFSNAKIIGYANEINIRITGKALSCGIRRVLKKPLQMPELIAAMDELST